jgi:hypothetical protein
MSDQDWPSQVAPLLANSQAVDILAEECSAQVAKDDEQKLWGQLHNLEPRDPLVGESVTSTQHDGG